MRWGLILQNVFNEILENPKISLKELRLGQLKNEFPCKKSIEILKGYPNNGAALKDFGIEVVGEEGFKFRSSHLGIVSLINSQV